MSAQFDLFGGHGKLPEGFRYQPDVIGAKVESDLVERLRGLPFKEFEFYGGYKGKRRVLSFGWKYDYSKRAVEKAVEIPQFLIALRRTAAEFAGMRESDLEQITVIEYGPGAGIGWHRDKPQFGEVVAISLLSPCRFRLRRKAGSSWERIAFTVEPRSAYLLSGESRTAWEHSIPPVDELRYSVTLRNRRKT